MNINFEELLKTATKLKENIKQNPMPDFKVQGESGAGMVKIILDSKYRVLDINIEDEALTMGKNPVQDLVKAAFNSALNQIQEKLQEHASKSFGEVFK
jgi:DNA-binding YbaB/EbfC family protein